jgi:hypothetical protein
MTTTLQPGRSSATGIVFAVGGLMRFTLDLVSQERSGKSEDGGMKLACTHPHIVGEGDDAVDTGPSPVTQQYTCDADPRAARIDAAMRSLAADPEDTEALLELSDATGEAGHGPYSISDLGRARWVTVGLDKDGNEVKPKAERDPNEAWAEGDVDDEPEPNPVVTTVERFVVASREDIAAAKVGSLDKEYIAFSVHPADEIDLNCRPGKKGYLVRPAKGKSKKVTPVDEEAYAAIKALASQPDIALVGSLRLRDTRSVFRLGLWGDQVVLSELLMPSDLKERDSIEPDPLAEDTVAGLIGLVKAAAKPFDEDAHRWDVEAAVSELVAQAAAAGPAETVAPVYNEKTLDELLALAIQAQTDSTTAA